MGTIKTLAHTARAVVVAAYIMLLQAEVPCKYEKFLTEELNRRPGRSARKLHTAPYWCLMVESPDIST